MDKKVIALVGNPNVGKTVLFNSLTDSFERVGNWHGVTVDKKIKTINYKKSEYKIVDLPGVYNLSGYSLEEKQTAKYLSDNNCSVVNICDIRQLERNLYLTLLLLEKNYSVVLFINNYVKNGGKVDVCKLNRLLGVEILSTTAEKVKPYDLFAKNFRHLTPQYYDENFKTLDEEKKAQIRYKYIEDLLKSCDYKISSKKAKFDNLLVGRCALPTFCLICLAIFYLCFGGVGSFLSQLLQSFLQKVIYQPIFNFINGNCSAVVVSLICDGVLSALLGLLAFLPQIILVTFFIYLLQDSGYLSRIAFLFDGLLSKMGLSGKAVFSLLIGLGCNTTALMTSNNQEDYFSKKKVAIFLPFVCCSAKFPIFIVFSQILVMQYGVLLTIALYLFALLCGVCVLYVYNKMFGKSETQTFLLEMGELKLPNVKAAIRECGLSVKSFFIKVGTTIFLANIIVWVLQTFDFSFSVNSGGSMLRTISQAISILFAPIGLDNYCVVAALIIGVMAKELTLTTLAMLNGIGLSQLGLLFGKGLLTSFSPLTMIIFLVFVAIYSPCISYLGIIKKNFGKKLALSIGFGQTIFAYVVCMIIYFFGKLYLVSKEIFVMVIFCLVVFMALFYFVKHKGKCVYCRNKNCSKCQK